MAKRNLIDSMKKIIVALGGAESVEDIDENNVVEIADRIAEAISDGGDSSSLESKYPILTRSEIPINTIDSQEYVFPQKVDQQSGKSNAIFKKSKTRFIFNENSDWESFLMTTDSETSYTYGYLLSTLAMLLYITAYNSTAKTQLTNAIKVIQQASTQGILNGYGGTFYVKTKFSILTYEAIITCNNSFVNNKWSTKITISDLINSSISISFLITDYNIEEISNITISRIPSSNTNSANKVLSSDSQGFPKWIDLPDTMPFIVNCSGTTEESNVNIDKTFQEITNAYNSGRQVIAKYKISDNLFYLVPLMALANSWIQFYTYQFGEVKDDPNSHIAIRILIQPNNNNTISYIDNL